MQYIQLERAKKFCLSWMTETAIKSLRMSAFRDLLKDIVEILRIK